MAKKRVADGNGKSGQSSLVTLLVREQSRRISQNFSPAGVTSPFVARANLQSEVRCQPRNNSGASAGSRFATGNPSGGGSELSDAVRW
jgi:hypothetical protein